MINRGSLNVALTLRECRLLFDPQPAGCAGSRGAELRCNLHEYPYSRC